MVKLELESRVGWKQLSTPFDIISTVMKTILTCVLLSLTCTMLSIKLNEPVFFVNLNATSLGYTPAFDGAINIHLTSNLVLWPFSAARRSIGAFAFLLSSVRFHNVPSNISFQLWYLDDGTFVGTRPAVAELLELFRTHGPSFGLTLNLKCEIFWPSGDPTFQDIPPEICRPL